MLIIMKELSLSATEWFSDRDLIPFDNSRTLYDSGIRSIMHTIRASRITSLLVQGFFHWIWWKYQHTYP